MRQGHKHASDRRGWRMPIVFLGFAAIAGYFLLTEHRVHALSILPWALLLLACPLLHMFMHGGHGGHGGQGGDDDQRASNNSASPVRDRHGGHKVADSSVRRR